MSTQQSTSRTRLNHGRQVETTTIRRIATGIVAALALATATSASATPWDPNSRDPVIPIRPAPEPAMIAPAPIHAGNRPAVVITERSPSHGQVP
jgi:hypothetical protein